MLILTYSEITEKIEKKYNLSPSDILCFNYKDRQTLEKCTIQPGDLINLVKYIESLGIKYEGCECDGGKVKEKAISSLEEFLKKENNHVSFVYLTKVFFYKRDSPSGLIVLTSWGWIFIPGVTNYQEQISINFIEQPKEKKKMLTEVSKKWDIKWWGSWTQPVLFMTSKPDIESFKKFINSVNGFFEEVGYAEI